jgi:hypothetical protein
VHLAIFSNIECSSFASVLRSVASVVVGERIQYLCSVDTVARCALSCLVLNSSASCAVRIDSRQTLVIRDALRSHNGPA